MIKFLDLKKINTSYRSEFSVQFDSFLESGSYILGPQVDKFETEFAEFCNTKYCLGVSNGLDALKLILEAYKITGKLTVGDEVIVPANTYIATVLAVSQAGLIPVFVSPNFSTYNIDSEKIESKVTKKTKAILAVHLYGQLYNVERLEALCKNHNLLLIEDAAQAHGAIYKDGRLAGGVSNAAAFSFYPTKNLGALGDGGAITTDDKNLCDVIRKLRNYGRASSYKNDYKGFNCRLDEIQAGFLRIKLRTLQKDNQLRRDIATRYLNEIKSECIQLPNVDNLQAHVFHLFVVRAKNREDFKTYLFDNGVQTAIHYPVPIDKQKAYTEIKVADKITDTLSNEVLSIPLNPILKEEEVDTIIKVISNYHIER